MNLTELDVNFYAAAQLYSQDFALLAKRGVKSVIYFSPDGEAEDQPSNAELEQAAQNAGLNFSYVPIAVQTLTNEERVQSRRVLRTLPAPICGFCRSGARAALAWGLEGAHNYHASDVLKFVAGAGLPADVLQKQLHGASAINSVD